MAALWLYESATRLPDIAGDIIMALSARQAVLVYPGPNDLYNDNHIYSHLFQYANVFRW